MERPEGVSTHQHTLDIIKKLQTHEVKLILCPVDEFRKEIGGFWRKKCMNKGGVSVSLTKSGRVRRMFFGRIQHPNAYKYIAGLVWGKITHIGYVDTSSTTNKTSERDGL